jgi:TFIIF-interacting CTD phosphatase-like protein
MAEPPSPARRLIVFDLDETVVHAPDEPLRTACRTHHFGQDAVIERPHVEALLRALQPTYALAIWTSGAREYGEFVAEHVFRPHVSVDFVWGAERCTQRYDFELGKHYPIKDLRKVFRRGYAREHVLMVDNTPRKLERNYGNLVHVRDFVGDPADEELLALTEFLLSLATAPDVRPIEKRGWRHRFGIGPGEPTREGGGGMTPVG